MITLEFVYVYSFCINKLYKLSDSYSVHVMIQTVGSYNFKYVI